MSLNVHHLNGNLLVGSSHFYVDTLTNKVGITTTNPDAGLHVNSNAYVNTDFRVGADIAMNVASGRITAGSFDGDGSLLSGINSDSGSWVKDDANSKIYVSNTSHKVGIGTTVPDATLDVNGSITGRIVPKTRTITHGVSSSGEVDTFTLQANEQYIILNNAQGSADQSRTYFANFNSGVPTDVGTIMYLEINSSRTNIDSVGRGHQSEIQFDGTSVLSTGYVYLNSGETYNKTLKRVIILTSNGWEDLTDIKHGDDGRLGIGTSTPQQKLEVHGNILLGQNQVKSFIHGGNSVAVSSDADVLIVADSNDTSGAIGSNSIIFGAGSAVDTDDRDFTYAQAYPNDVPRVELMRITADSISGEAGRLGLGTASPEEKIHFHANHEYIYQRFSTTAAGTTDKFDIACWNSTRSNGDHGVMFVNRANTDMRFINNNSEWMRIKNDGKVGIGRNDPQEKLHVVGNIAVNWSNDRRIIMNYDNSYRQGIEMDAGTRTMTLFSTGGGGDGGALVFRTREATGSSDSDYGTQRMRINKNGSIVIGDVGGYAVGGYTDAQLTIGGTHNQSSGYNTSNQIKLLITGGNNDGSSPYYVLCEDENARVQFYVKGSTSDNTGTGQVFMRGWLRVQGTGGTNTGASTHAGFLYSHTSLQRWNGNHSNVGIFADDDIMTHGYILAINGTFSASDRRIKKDITDIDDGAALQCLRQLQPKQYKYKDTYNKPEDTVWGFIAQDVRETIPNSTQIRTECIPDINELATVSGTNVITFTDFDTSNLEIGTIIRIHDDGNAAHEIKVTAIIDAHSIRVEEDVSKWARSFNEDGTMGEGNSLYVYGQKVDDFVFIKKDAIWTVAVAAVQEIDRQLQAEKAKVADLEERLANHTHPLEPHTHPELEERLANHTHPLEPHTHSDLVDQLTIEKAKTQDLQQRITLLEHSHTALVARLEALENL